MKDIIEKLGITPAPWRNAIGENTSYIMGRDTLTHEVVVAHSRRDPVIFDETWERHIKDFNLIATAPEMLEALIDCVFMVENGHPVDFIKPAMFELLEKATGKTWEEIKEIIQ